MPCLLIIIAVRPAIPRQRSACNRTGPAFYHSEHPLAARDALAQALCTLYEPGVVRSFCMLAVPAHLKESGQKVTAPVQRVAPVGELKLQV